MNYWKAFNILSPSKPVITSRNDDPWSWVHP
jgi:hypothetical protein